MTSMFVDECKQNQFILVGFIIPDFQRQAMRKKLRGELLPGQGLYISSLKILVERSRFFKFLEIPVANSYLSDA